jgi:hypothetical protein
MTKCSTAFLMDIGVIFAHSDQLNLENLNKNIDDWVSQIDRWKNSGLFSSLWDYMGSFIDKNSILIDESVYIFPSSTSDLEKILKKSLCRTFPSTSIQRLSSLEKSRFSF